MGHRETIAASAKAIMGGKNKGGKIKINTLEPIDLEPV